jgi:hypothetical protein
MSKYVKTQARTQGLGRLHLKLHLVVENKADANGCLENYSCRYNAIPPEVEVDSVLRPTAVSDLATTNRARRSRPWSGCCLPRGSKA